MSARSPIGKPIIGRPRSSRTIGPCGSPTIVKATNGRHNQQDAESIPEVPRIPDKFRPRKETGGSSLAQDIPRNFDDNKDDLESASTPHVCYLPNCSFGQPKEVQVISNAIMQTYIAMRGNNLGEKDEIDPLFEWIQQREELAQASKPKIHDERDVLRMLRLMDKALEASNMGGDSPRDCVFEVYRPDFKHIVPPQDMDMSANVFTACCTDFEWERDSDDEEADVPSGRISPCTFLQWSKDCVRWNADENEIKEDTEFYRRTRPPTPKAPAPPKRHQHIPCGYLEPQWDIHTGEELTPTYYVPTSPSIIYTPPGVEFTGFRTASFHMQYKRMAPLVERELRTKLYGCEEEFSQLPDGEKDRFSPSSVEAAIAEVPELHGRRGPEIEAAFRGQWAAIRQAEEADRALYWHAEQQCAHIERLQFDRRHLGEFMPALHARREMRDRRAEAAAAAAAAEQQKQQQLLIGGSGSGRKRGRGETIRAYIAEHALEAQSRLDTAWFRLHDTQARVSENALRIAALEREVSELCLQGGVRDPEHAYAVLMGADSEGRACGSGEGNINVSGNHAAYNNVNGGSGGHGGLLGPWSDSSLARAEEEYDCFLADLQMEGTMKQRASGTGSRGWEKRSDDYKSGDSGIAGVRSQAQNRPHRQGSRGIGNSA
ncbi:hypothetical protein F4802DRAFT_595752 [Xylaria palmicola]|nr:hypothetical protein F4802DRAFT_595752 [Xylaria palmicola]